MLCVKKMNKLLKRTPIRVKMMFWYLLLAVTLLGISVPILYQMIHTSLYANLQAQLEASITQVIAAIEVEGPGKAVWDSEHLLSHNTLAVVLGVDGSELFGNTNMEWVEASPFYPGKTRCIETPDGWWMVLDEEIQSEGQLAASVRVCASLEPLENSLAGIRLGIALASPAYIAVATLGSYWIAKGAMKPISSMTATAQSIEGGDLSRRISGVESADEVGKLASTFNEMLERLETAFRREKQFASDASHELRTPVAVISACAEDILKHSEPLDPAISCSAEAILAETRRMNRTISQLLLLTRGYEGRYRLELERLDLADVIESVQEQMENAASKAGISLSSLAPPGMRVLGDQSLLTQMLLNLVENGIKYGTPGGFVRIAVQKGENEIHLSVEDNGIGIPKEEQPLVFERFYRADKARDRSGSGLGLSIVKWIVQEHHGSLSLQSAPGRGSVFKVCLPACRE